MHWLRNSLDSTFHSFCLEGESNIGLKHHGLGLCGTDLGAKNP